jgi:RimJ/RimL family protein N-acetyltransferase
MTPAAAASSVELNTDRLLLRPWQSADAARLQDICQDRLIAHYSPVHVPYSRADAVAYIEATNAAWADGSGAAFAATMAGSGIVVASVTLRGFDHVPGLAHVGFLAAREHRGRGYVTEAVAALCRWGFEDLRLRRIEWYAEVGNEASRRVAEKVGFQFEGTLRRRLHHRGEWVDAWLAALLRDDAVAAAGHSGA